MCNYYQTRSLKLFLTVIIIAMTLQAHSQVPPEYDKVNTSAGVVEMHFFGHGSLMFKVNGFVIYIDPVRSSGNYDFFPKADIILVTHEHGDHLDVNLIDSLKKQGTLVFCNANSLAKVKWAMAMKAGDRQEINNIIIEAVPAYNRGKPYHPRSIGVGYIVTLGEKRLYHAGDYRHSVSGHKALCAMQRKTRAFDA